MFQVWASNQVMEIVGTNLFQSRYKGTSLKCSSCTLHDESCAHVLTCPELGRVDTLMRTVDMMDRWLLKTGTDYGLSKCMCKYAKRRGSNTMEEIARRIYPRLHRFAVSQDKIRWRRFMEVMVSKEIMDIQRSFLILSSVRTSFQNWISGL